MTLVFGHVIILLPIRKLDVNLFENMVMELVDTQYLMMRFIEKRENGMRVIGKDTQTESNKFIILHT